MQHNLRNGHIELPLEYVEPIFPRNRGERRMDGVTFERMHLGFLPNPEFISYNFTPDQLADFALAFLVDHYDIPEEHPAVQTVIQSISIPIA